jgi:hypothetical protein
VRRDITHGEKFVALVEEIARLTYESGGNEHAIVTTRGGRRLIVEGGSGGIRLGRCLRLRRVLVHAHPSPPTGPSDSDKLMLRQTGQRSSWLYEAQMVQRCKLPLTKFGRQ